MSMRLIGHERVLKALGAFRPGQQRTMLRKAVRAAGKPVVAKAKANVPSSPGLDEIPDHGILRQSINNRIVTYPRKDTIVNVIGPRNERRVIAGGRRQTRSKAAVLERLGALGAIEQPKVVNPGRYGWIVEMGSRHSRAQPFLGPAFNATRRQALQIIERVLWNEISRRV